jgi:hypothetical protein
MGVIILGPASVVPKNYLMWIADSLDVELVKMSEDALCGVTIGTAEVAVFGVA